MLCRLCKKYIWDGRLTSALFHLGLVHDIESYGLWNTNSPKMIEKIASYFKREDI